ncbi:MAG TPA: hypothetical protein VNO21_01090, partial [Polyangiaceae bacterium]|nr:hypothetical protein [Polyangiaceae bacterium]
MNGFRKSLQSGSSLSGPASPKASLSGPAPADGLPTSGVASIAGSEARRMGRYEALARLGNGGMATVFVGRPIGDVDLSRLVALKRAHEHVRQDPDLVDGL